MKRNQSGLLILFFLHFFIVLHPGFSQNKISPTKFANVFNQFRSHYLQDQLFVHTDKNSYVCGEILWFRIYYVDALYNRPGTISSMAYVEILDGNNLPVLQQKVSLKPGESNGSFILPLNMASGIYKFRAYTSWMKNDGPDYFFEKAVQIINPQNLLPDTTILLKARLDIQFFPEGGNLVQDIESRIGFRVTNAYGKGLDFVGVVVTSNGDTVAKFRPLHMGLGSFILKPLKDQLYKAVIRFANGEEVARELPVVYKSGCVMNLSKTGEENINIRIQASPDLAMQEIYLFVHGNRGSLPVSSEQLANGTTTFNIRMQDLEDGISSFTVFNKDGQPVSERLYFRYPQKRLLLSEALDSIYPTRTKIDLNISSADQSDKPLAADMSLAVYKLDSIQHIDETDIRYYFYLMAELGPIESPSFYFRDDVKNDYTAMDNLMLTHGWRRYRWKAMMGQKPPDPEFPPEYRGHIIRGKLTNGKTGVPVPNKEVYVSIPSTRSQFRPTVTDSAGNFRCEMNGFYGSDELIVQTNLKTDTSSQIEILSPFSKKYSAFPLPDFRAPSKYSSVLLGQSIHEQVQHIYDGVKLNQFSLQETDTNGFYFEPDEKYLLDDYTRFLTMEEVLREYVRSVSVTNKRDKFQLYLVDNPHKILFESEPLVLIDGVPFFDANELFRQDPKKVRRIDLINREYALGSQTFQGIVNVTTYHGDLDGIQMNPHATVLDYPGIPEQREFFSPVYETEKQISTRMPDYRTLLYWAPDISSGIQGKTQVNFYTSDLPGKYAAVVQGISENGEPGSNVIIFNVKNR
jgi:hypothetical protein